MGRTENLAIQYIHGKLSAVVWGAASLPRNYEHPEIINSPDELAKILEILPKEVQFKNGNVSFVIADESIFFHSLKTPPMKRKYLLQFLSNKAKLVWAKEDPFVWAWNSQKVHKNEENIYLHLLPKTFFTIFIDFCTKNNFQPTHFFTLAAIAPAVLEYQPNKGGGVELVAVSVGTYTFLLVGTKKSAYVVRELPYTWSQEDQLSIDKLSREIQRTVLFTRQQFNEEVNVLRLIGTEAHLVAELSGNLTGLTPKVTEADLEWMTLPFFISPNRTDNLVPKEIVTNRTRKRYLLALGFSTLFILLVLFFTDLKMHRVITRIDKQIVQAGFIKEADELINTKQNLDNIRNSIVQYENLVKFMENQKTEPIPGYFTSFATDKLPEKLTLTHLKITRDSLQNEWRIEIEGLTPRDPIISESLLETYEKILENDPCRLIIDIPYKMQWIENLKNGGTTELQSKPKMFRIQGRIR